MPAITLKALPVALHRQLKARAARNKRSLNREVIATLEDALATSREVDVTALLRRTEALRARLNFEVQPDELTALKSEGRP